MSSGLTVILILILLSFLPAIAYLAWVRKSERYNQEGWAPLLRSFLFGALISTFISGVLELILQAVYSTVVQPDISSVPQGATNAYLVLAIVIAPLVEEGMKGLGVYASRNNFRYVADGLVFGAAVGFGFGFVENTLYGLSALQEAGFAAAIATLFVRAISSVLLHGSATAMTGYGVAENSLHEGRGHVLAGYYFLAVLMHATFNALASLPYLLPQYWVNKIGLDLLSLISLLLAIAYAMSAFSHIRNRIAELQFQPLRASSMSPATMPRIRR